MCHTMSSTFWPDIRLLRFTQALKQVQQEQPVYRGGANEWWGDVIRRTAVGAGADPLGAYMWFAAYVLMPTLRHGGQR